MDRQVFRTIVLAGMCPFCDAGPFKIVAGHTNRAHGVDRKKLRDLAGLTFTASITAPDLHAEWSEMRRAEFQALNGRDRAALIAKRAAATRGREAARQFSQAGRESQRERATRNQPEHSSKGGQAMKHQVEARLAPEYELVAKTYTEILKQQSGDRYGVVPKAAQLLGWSEHRVWNRVRRARVLGLLNGVDSR